MPRKGDAKERGYGYEHRRLRAALVATIEGRHCTRCGRALKRGDDVDLDHTDDRLGYLGLACRSCNRAEGARKGNRSRVRPDGGTSRSW